MLTSGKNCSKLIEKLNNRILPTTTHSQFTGCRSIRRTLSNPFMSVWVT